MKLMAKLTLSATGFVRLKKRMTVVSMLLILASLRIPIAALQTKSHVVGTNYKVHMYQQCYGFISGKSRNGMDVILAFCSSCDIK